MLCTLFHFGFGVECNSQTRFAEHFSEEPVWTKTEYSSPNIAVTVTEYKHPEAYPEMTYYVADVYIADISSFVISTHCPVNPCCLVNKMINIGQI